MSSNHLSSAPSPRASHSSALRNRRTRTALSAGAAVLLALPVLAACSAGANPEVYQIRPDAGQATAGLVWISNVWVVADPNTGNAEVIGQVANTDPNTTDSVQLTSVTVNGNPAAVQQSPAPALAPGVAVNGSAVTVPGLASVQFGQDGQPSLTAADPGVTVGQNTQVVYSFSNGGTATVTAQVQPNTGDFAQYNPNGQAVASALPSPAAPGGAATAPATTVSPSAAATASASPSA